MKLKGIFKSRLLNYSSRQWHETQLVTYVSVGFATCLCENFLKFCLLCTNDPKEHMGGFSSPKITYLKTTFCSPENMITLRLYLISP